MPTTEEELIWESIEKTRVKDKNTQTPEPGALGQAFLRHHNGMVDRVLVLHKDRNFNVKIQRVYGGKMHVVAIKHLRTLDQIITVLKNKYPERVPAKAAVENYNPAMLPMPVINVIWGVS